MALLLSFTTKKRRTSKTGPSQAVETRESAAQDRPHAFAHLEEDATYHCAGRQAIGPKPEK